MLLGEFSEKRLKTPQKMTSAARTNGAGEGISTETPTCETPFGYGETWGVGKIWKNYIDQLLGSGEPMFGWLLDGLDHVWDLTHYVCLRVKYLVCKIFAFAQRA